MWRRAFAAFRIVLAISAAGLIVDQHGLTQPQFLIPVAAYGAYAALIPVLRRLRQPSMALLNLLADAAVLLLVLHALHGSSFLLSAFWFAFLMVSGLGSHPWRQVAIVGTGCIAFVTVVRPPGWENTTALWTAMTCLALLALWHRDRLEQRLYEISRQGVLFRSEAIQARDNERQRIADDFHDGPLQIFMSLQMRLEVARRLLEKRPDAAKKEVEEMAEIWKSQIIELRAFLRSMRASDVDASELNAALSRAVDAFQKDTGISTAFSAAGSLELQQPGLASEILQVVREALHNVRKHGAKATHVSVQVAAGKGFIEIVVDDNGQGFPFAGAFNLEEMDLLRVGPGSIKRRIRAIGGELTVESTPARGSTLRMRIPQ
jgi:signal transduction histidine kinase